MSTRTKTKKTGPRILVWDIETAPIVGNVWSLWQQNVGLNQIVKDWHMMSWSAKWYGDAPSKVMYADQRKEAKAGRVEDDRRIVKELWKLLDEADVVITQNGKAFDEKKFNARCVAHGLTPPSPYKHIDTKRLAKKRFAFTSNRLEYMTEKFCTRYTKLKSKKFVGHELWTQCIAGNLAAWKEMERYNKRDVLSLEELYKVLQAWDTTDLSAYQTGTVTKCRCGTKKALLRRGFAYTAKYAYQRLQCPACGAWHKGDYVHKGTGPTRI